MTERVSSPATYNTPRDAGSIADLRERIVVITGATRGIGRAAALALAQLGAEVVVVGRDEERLRETHRSITSTTWNSRVATVKADFASLDAVRSAAAEISKRWPTVHVLINNAGINSARGATSTDGHELTFAVNCLAPFLLTALLVPSLARASAARVVNVSSVFAHFGRVDVGDLMFDRRRYDATRAYTQSKLAGAMLTIELASRLLGGGVTVNDVYPGLVATDLLREHWYSARWLRPLWSEFLFTPEMAGRRLVHAATSPGIAGMTGQAFAGGDAPARMPTRTRDATVRQALWDACVRLTHAPEVTALAEQRR